MILKDQPGQGVYLFAYDVANDAPKTGDAANITGVISKDGAADGALATTHPTEIGRGRYWQPLSQAETAANALSIAWQSSTADISIDPVSVLTTGVNLPAVAPGQAGGLPTVDGSNRIAGIQGTKHTFDDLNDLAQAQAESAAALGAAAALTAYDAVSQADLDAAEDALTGAIGESEAVVTTAIGSPLQADDARITTMADAAAELAPLIVGGQFTAEALENAPAGGGGGGLTAQDVWEYDGPRTLTQPAAQLADIDEAGTITVRRGDTITIPLTGVGDLSARTKLWFTVKSSLADPDSQAVIQIEEAAGLLALRREETTDEQRDWGSINVTDPAAGDLTITLSEIAAALLKPASNAEYDLQILTPTRVITRASGKFNIRGDVTLATS